MDETFIQEIASLATPEVKTLNGFDFIFGPKGIDQVKFPVPGLVKVFSLSQLVSFIKQADTGVPLIVNIESEVSVSVFEKKINLNGLRTSVASADFSKIVETFPFGSRLSQEDFIIKLMTMFVKNYERDELIKLVGAVRAEKVQTSEDDGISQVAQVKQGVVLTEDRRVENIWLLQPYKTFPEVTQPTVRHMLRLHQRGDELPQFALYDCDGGRWRVDATLEVRKYLQEQLADFSFVTVL